ncbi:MAG TPA: hypothetical protein VLS26_06360 [Azonexus sp.]|nr:hypothetical protein [Azonexus sp.]
MSTPDFRRRLSVLGFDVDWPEVFGLYKENQVQSEEIVNTM